MTHTKLKRRHRRAVRPKGEWTARGPPTGAPRVAPTRRPSALLPTSTSRYCKRPERRGGAKKIGPSASPPPDTEITSMRHTRKLSSSVANRAWPLKSADMTPLAWWRSLPSDKFADAEKLSIQAVLQRISVPHADDDLRGLLLGDPDGVIRITSAITQGQTPTLEVDIAMTAVLRCALEGHAVAAFVVGNVIGRMDLGHEFATELSASWYAKYLSRWPGRRHLPEVASLLQIYAHGSRAPGKYKRPTVRR